MTYDTQTERAANVATNTLWGWVFDETTSTIAMDLIKAVHALDVAIGEVTR